MEDPEARRARLRAIREQAEGVSQSAPAPASEGSVPKLANPFEEAAPASDAQTSRFNYYSNPAAGFVHTARRESGPPAGLRSSPYTGPPPPPPQGNWNPDFYPPASVPPPMGPQVGGFGSPIPLYDPMQPGLLHPPPALEPQQRYGDRSWPTKRPNIGSGREAGRSFGGRGSGPRGRNQGRGRGSGPASAREDPDLFYQKSMVEDPWRHLV